MTGIDYGSGTVNIDTETGVRFGAMSENHSSLCEWFWDSVDSHYTPSCPKCGSDAVSIESDDLPDEEVVSKWGELDFCPEFACERCEIIYGESAYGDEPDYLTLSGDGIEARVDSHNDIVITKSPFVTFGRFASPCFPGGVTICGDGSVEAYCLGPDWFTDNPPYDVYTIISGDYYKIVKDTDGRLWACGTDESLKSRIREVRYKADCSLKFKGGTNV